MTHETALLFAARVYFPRDHCVISCCDECHLMRGAGSTIAKRCSLTLIEVVKFANISEELSTLDYKKV